MNSPKEYYVQDDGRRIFNRQKDSNNKKTIA